MVVVPRAAAVAVAEEADGSYGRPMTRSVSIIEQGREGRVRYSEGGRSLDGYWEFGGGDVVAIVNAGTREDWSRMHPWAVEQRAGILRFIADEVIRQRAPACIAEIDEQRGDILLRQTGGGTARATVRSVPPPQAKATAFVRRYSKLKALFAIGLAVVALIVGGIYWAGKKVFMVTAVSGIPLNECVRYGGHDQSRNSGIASLIRTTDPHPVEISGRGASTTASVSILLIPLDGSSAQVVPVASGLNGNSLGLSRIMGSDLHTLWFDAAGLCGVRLSDYELITPEDLRKANPTLDPSWWEDPRGMRIADGRLYVMRIDRSAAIAVDPATLRAADVPVDPSHNGLQTYSITDQLAAGLITAPNTWLGLLSPEELAGEFSVGKYIKAVENAADNKQLRRLCTAQLEPSSDGRYLNILRIAPIADAEYLNAAFLRLGRGSEPLRLKDPDGALMVHTSAPGLQGTLIVSRVDAQGRLIWSTDTGLDRFALKQILPGTDVFAFVGTRPKVEGKLSEPLVVLVNNASGALTCHSLWR